MHSCVQFFWCSWPRRVRNNKFFFCFFLLRIGFLLSFRVDSYCSFCAYVLGTCQSYSKSDRSSQSTLQSKNSKHTFTTSFLEEVAGNRCSECVQSINYAAISIECAESQVYIYIIYIMYHYRTERLVIIDEWVPAFAYKQKKYLIVSVKAWNSVTPGGVIRE